MSSVSQQLADIRRLHAARYQRHVALKKHPDLQIITPKELAGRKITRALKKHRLVQPINLSEEEWYSIPPLYRARVYFTTAHRIPPEPKPEPEPKKKQTVSTVKTQAERFLLNKKRKSHYDRWPKDPNVLKKRPQRFGSRNSKRNRRGGRTAHKSSSDYRRIDELPAVDFDEELNKAMMMSIQAENERKKLEEKKDKEKETEPTLGSRIFTTISDVATTLTGYGEEPASKPSDEDQELAKALQLSTESVDSTDDTETDGSAGITADEELQLAIQASLNQESKTDKEPEPKPESKSDKQKDEYLEPDDDLLQRALMMSMTEATTNPEATDTETEVVAPVSVQEEGLCHGFDLRMIHHQLSEPIYHGSEVFFFDHEQQEKLTRLWNRVNPATATGHNLAQKLKYYLSLCRDYQRKGLYDYPRKKY